MRVGKGGVAVLKGEVERLRSSRVTVILLVYSALVLDNMLLTVVVPIIPDYLYQLEYQHLTKTNEETHNTATSATPSPDATLTSSPHTHQQDNSSSFSRVFTEEDLIYPTLPKLPRPDPVESRKWTPDRRAPDTMDFYAVEPKRLKPNRLETNNKYTSRANRLNLQSSTLQEEPVKVLSFTSLPVKSPKALQSKEWTTVTDNDEDTTLQLPYTLPSRRSEKVKNVNNEDYFDRESTKSWTQRKTFNANNSSIWVFLAPEMESKKYRVNKRGTDRGYYDTGSENNHKTHTNEQLSTLLSTKRQFLLPLEDDIKVKDLVPVPTDTTDQEERASSSSASTEPLKQGKPEILQQDSDEENVVPPPTSTETLKQMFVGEDNVSATKEITSAAGVGDADGPSASSGDKLPQDIIKENGRVGLLFASKAMVQLVVNPMVGPLTAHIGYSLPLILGTHNLILSALLFAYAQSYGLMFLARSLQGIASSCIAIAGMGIIAECYPEDGERGRMQGLVMGGIALGVMAGYPLGSLLYDFTGSKSPPFLVVAALAALLALVQLTVLNPRPAPERCVVSTQLTELLRDPYILVTAGAVMVSTSVMAVLEPCLPIWLTDTLHPQKWQLGTAFLPDSVGYLVGTSCTAGPAYRFGRWRAALLAMLLLALATATVPEARSMLALAGPHLCLGLGVGTVDASLMPLLAALVDARHVAAYGAVYAIAQAAVSLAYFLGPLVGGVVVEKIGFPWLMRCMAILNLCYCPILCFLSTFNQDTAGETQAILMAAPRPIDYTKHITTVVQPKESSLRYHQLFDEEEE